MVVPLAKRNATPPGMYAMTLARKSSTVTADVEVPGFGAGDGTEAGGRVGATESDVLAAGEESSA